MTCSHRRRRPVLAVLGVLAAVLIAGGYGLMAGTAHGHADAMKINQEITRTSYEEGPEMTLKEFMTDPGLVAAVRDQLTASFEGVPGVRAPDPEEVIDEAIRSIRLETLDRIGEQATCNHVDDCRAKAVVLERFSAWLETTQP